MLAAIAPMTIGWVVILYFGLLISISYFTSRNADSRTFFTANRNSPWLLVAFGMIGASLSGVTFISIPGVVGKGGYNMAFSYMQMVLGYLVGYAAIALILMPLYYRLNLTTIYGYLEHRFGRFSYKIGAFYFILSRVIGASLRLFLVAIVLQKFLMDPIGIPFAFTVMITIVLIWVYTFSGGIKTIVITDTLQTICMLTAVVCSILFIGDAMNMNVTEMVQLIRESEYSKTWFFDVGWNDPNNFFKQFVSGALIALVMTGLDQDMMQKNLSCKTLKDAQKNIFTFSIILIFANLLFLSLGALLYIFATKEGIPIPESTDQLYPTIAFEYLPQTVGILFILGLIAAAYSSADSALTSLTTAFCIDFLNFEKSALTESEKKKQRILVHIGFSILLFFVIVATKALNAGAIINELFAAAGYTYGPLLGLFSFGIFTKRTINDRWVILVCILAPIFSYILNNNSDVLLGGFKFGSTIIALNGILTLIGLFLISQKTENSHA